MSLTLSSLISAILKFGAVALVLNEVRGIILAVPVLFAMVHSGGELMAIWVGFCSLAGIAISVIVPLFAAKKIDRLVKDRAAKAGPAQPQPA
ncbi:hypothetical protein [Erythrobacter sp. MTPC3]|uniref:hypothetical protein n=1 Tax=Erythrobacter sp. MTPC3 TaxID=3056564 RepID=UPI0036F1A45C